MSAQRGVSVFQKKKKKIYTHFLIHTTCPTSLFRYSRALRKSSCCVVSLGSLNEHEPNNTARCFLPLSVRLRNNGSAPTVTSLRELSRSLTVVVFTIQFTLWRGLRDVRSSQAYFQGLGRCFANVNDKTSLT